MLIWSFQIYVPNFCSKIGGNSSLVVVLHQCPWKMHLLQNISPLSLFSREDHLSLFILTGRKVHSVITVTSSATWRKIADRGLLLKRRNREGPIKQQMLQNILSKQNLPFTPLWLKGVQIMSRLLPGTLTLVHHAISLTGMTGLLTSHLSVIPWYSAVSSQSVTLQRQKKLIRLIIP